MASFTITGFLADVWQKKIYPAAITVEKGIIQSDPTAGGRLPGS